MDKETDKLTNIVGISTLILILLFMFIIVKVLINEDEKDKFFSERIGETIVINNDTLVIVDSHTSSRTYILSNGISINSKLIE